MSERKWALITNGATFEALVGTLIQFENPNDHVFSRSGMDGGQDALSSDGTCVFQAKHHVNGAAAKARKDAEKEADKIKKYLTPGHFRHPQWSSVNKWKLVTNATFNPTDRQKWNETIVPLFARLGLAASYWDQNHLNGLLDKHPEVSRAFFDGEARVLLTLPEIRNRFLAEEPFLERSTSTEFFGRKTEKAEVEEFLASEQQFLLIHGPGGVGKTRFLLEFGEYLAEEGEWQFLGANVVSMSTTAAWFTAVVPERKTLLLVDEPDDEKILQLLVEQLGGAIGRTTKWKVAVVVRSPKDPVVRFLTAPRMKKRVKVLSLEPLSASDAESMCMALLTSGSLAGTPSEWRNKVSRKLARDFNRHPIWITLAVHLLESHGNLDDLPVKAEELAESYWQEIIRLHGQTSPEREGVLRWISLIGTLNREDESSIHLLAQESKCQPESEFQRMVTTLVNRRAIAQRGAENRLIEVKPDVIRDHILLSWLTVNQDFGDTPVVPSVSAKALVDRILQASLIGNISPFNRAILDSLVRLELRLALSSQPVDFLQPLFDGWAKSLDTATASQRLVVAEVLLDVASCRPIDVATVCRYLRTEEVDSVKVSGLFGEREVGYDDVVLALAWPLFHAAMGARTASDRANLLEELCAVVAAEASIARQRVGGIPKDGKRASALVERILEGGPQFWGDFEEPARNLTIDFLHDAVSAPSEDVFSILQALVPPAVAVERRQTQDEGYTIYIQSYIISPDHSGWETREVIRTKLKEALAASTTPLETKLALWPLFTEAHRSANQCRMTGPKDLQETLNAQLQDDLIWADEVFTSDLPGLEELTVARDLWNWHLQYDSNSERKVMSGKLEKFYVMNELAGEFEPLVSLDNWEDREKHLSAKAKQLAATPTSDGIRAFIDRANRFFGSTHKLSQLFGVALDLGKLWPGSPAMRDFVHESLASEDVSAISNFAAEAATGWVDSVRRKTPSVVHQLVTDLLEKCGNDLQRANLLLRIYALPPRPKCENLSAGEHALMRSCSQVFLNNGRGSDFIRVVGWTIQYRWSDLRSLIEKVLNCIPEDEMIDAVENLVEVLYRAVKKDDSHTQPDGIGVWFLEQLLRLSDIMAFGDMSEWYLNQFLTRSSRPSVTWLADVLKLRSSTGEIEGGQAIGLDRISRYVAPISKSDSKQCVVNAIERIVDLVSDDGTLGYRLPNILCDVDPDGHLVPSAVVRRFDISDGAEEIRRLASVSRAYNVNSVSWRTIAVAALARANDLSSLDQLEVFSSLKWGGLRSWSGIPGEVPELFVSEVLTARKRLEEENLRELRPFWEWMLTIAEAELKDQEEHAKEIRGE